jgi:hypothetical protein
MERATIIPATAVDTIKTPNPALNRTAHKRRLRVPSLLRSSAAGQRERYPVSDWNEKG